MNELSGKVEICFNITNINQFSDAKGSDRVNVTETINESDLKKIIERVREEAVNSAASFIEGTFIFDFEEVVSGKYYSVYGRYNVN